MHLVFVYYDKENNNFKRDLIRYNGLLKNYFTTDDQSIVKKLNETFQSLIKNSISHEMLSEKETEVYNVIIDFMANDLNQSELEDVQKQVYDDSLKERIVQKMQKDLPSIEPDVLQSVMEKSNSLIEKGNSSSVEIVFLPSAVNV